MSRRGSTRRADGPAQSGEQVVVYGTEWCRDSRRTVRWLDQARVPHRFIDLDRDSAARAHVRTLQRGGRQVPTVVLPNGAVLVVPSPDDLGSALAAHLAVQAHDRGSAARAGDP